MSLTPKDSGNLKRLGKTIELTNKLLHEIDDKIASLDDHYLVLIPDGNFRNHLEKHHSISFDGSFVGYSQINQIREINFSERSFQLRKEQPIVSLSGLQYFTALEKLVIPDF
uniref:hypothetical protein n=1 Tax=Flavobacterium sp. TaxID=239 RepID=UPI004049B7E3